MDAPALIFETTHVAATGCNPFAEAARTLAWRAYRSLRASNRKTMVRLQACWLKFCRAAKIGYSPIFRFNRFDRDPIHWIPHTGTRSATGLTRLQGKDSLGNRLCDKRPS